MFSIQVVIADTERTKLNPNTPWYSHEGGSTADITDLESPQSATNSEPPLTGNTPLVMLGVQHPGACTKLVQI